MCQIEPERIPGHRPLSNHQEVVRSLPMLQYTFLQDIFDLFDMHVVSFPCSGRHWNEMVVMAYLVERYRLREHFHVASDMQLYANVDSKQPMYFEESRPILKQLGVRRPLFSHDMTEGDLQRALSFHPEIVEEMRTAIETERRSGTIPATEGADEYVFCKALLSSFQPLPWSDLSWDRSHYQAKKVVLLTRNIKDTLVAFYFHIANLQKSYRSFSGTLSEFVRHSEYGARRMLTFLKIWERHSGLPDRFLHVRYEDLHNAPFESFGRLFELLLDERVNDDHLRDAIACGSFDNMRQLEEEGKIWDRDHKAKAGSYKVREGKVGKYREHLRLEDIAYIDAIAEEMGNPFNIINETVLTT
jgi:hypothetical protein